MKNEVTACRVEDVASGTWKVSALTVLLGASLSPSPSLTFLCLFYSLAPHSDLLQLWEIIFPDTNLEETNYLPLFPAVPVKSLIALHWLQLSY